MKQANRRAFLKNGLLSAGVATVGGTLLTSIPALSDDDEGRHAITEGDIAILRFLNALEQVEADLWLQYSELGGVQDNEVSGVGGGNAPYTAALTILDMDMPQYIHDNTDDEQSHAQFLKNYLESKGAQAVDLSHFKNLGSSQADGANKSAGRLTNLMELTVDTSFWSRYRSITNPDLGATKFAQAVPSLGVNKHTAIPRSNDDTNGSNPSNPPTSITTHLQAIAFTAGFHFAFIEQGGSSLYPTLAQKVTNLEVLRVLVSIGGSEVMHFQTWQDKAGNALPITDFDKVNNSTVMFSDLTKAQGETSPESRNGNTLQANLIMPEPAEFLNPDLGRVAIIRPTSDKLNGARAAVQGFVDDGLFIGHTVNGQSDGFVELLFRLADKADDARRGF